MGMSVDIKKLYFWCGIFLAYCLAAVYLDFYLALAAPVVITLIWVGINKPKYLLYFLAFTTPLSVHLIDERYSTVNLSIPTEPIIILLFIGVLLKLISSRTLKFPEVSVMLSVLIIADFGWLLVTAITSTMPLISVKYVLMKSWYLVVFYFLLSRYFQHESMAKKFIWLFTISIVLLAAYTLFMHSQGGFSRSYAYTAMRPFLPDHGMYAACVSFVVPVLFVFALHGSWLKYGLWLRVVCVLLFLFLVVAVALSFTRASWVSLVAALGIYALLRMKIRFHYLVLIALVGGAYLASNMDNLLTGLSRNKKESDDNIENHLQSV
ncbi:MAG TPA: hypothetical protein DCY51_02925, partial [Bacteroidetes bacterium]|nr:hypothetical protein [Bacteroidota bacterium]